MKKTEKNKDKKAMTVKVGRPMLERPSGPGSAFANFLIEHLDALPMTGVEIATQLGYARPNILSGWKAGNTKVTLDNIWKLSELLNVEPAYLLALYIDQYVSANNGVDRFKDIVQVLSHLTTPEEWEIIKVIREARRHNSLPLEAGQREELKKLFAVPETMPEGYFLPLDTLDHVQEGDRRRFARRGHPRAMSVSEIEEAEARKDAATKPEPKVRKRAAGKKETVAA